MERPQGVAGRFFSHEYTITTDHAYGVTVTAVDPQGASDVGQQRLYSSLCKMTSPLNLRGLKLPGWVRLGWTV